MADEEIKINLVIDGQAAMMTLGQFRERLGATGDVADKTSGAMKGFKFAAKEIGHQIGLSGGMSRMFGGELSELAMTAGAAGVAIGGVAIAGIAAYKVYDHFTEESKRLREEKVKLGMEAGKWIEGLLAEQIETNALAQAKKELRVAEFELNKARIDASIPETIAKLAQMEEAHRKLVAQAKNEAVIWFQMGGGWEESRRRAEELSPKIGELRAQLGMLQAQTKLFTPENEEIVARTKAEVDAIKLALEIKSALYSDNRKMLEDDAAMRMAIASAIYADNQKMLADDVSLKASISAALYADNQKMLVDAKAADLQRNNDAWAATKQRMDWEQQEQDAKREAVYSTANFVSASFQAMYQAGGSHARRNFSLFKMAASAEALINADRAAASAFAWGTQLGGPGLGGALAALAFAAGMARVKSIRSMTLEGGGGAGGAVPTYSASPTTGETSKSGPTSINININGQRVGTSELTGDVLRTIYNNGGSVDGFQVMVERTA